VTIKNGVFSQVNRTQAKTADQKQQRHDTASVLIINTDADTTRLILKILARKAIVGNLARDQKSVLDMLDKGDYNLVFASERVPKHCGARTAESNVANGRQGSGIELVRRIKTNMPELPVIMIGQNNSTNQPIPKGETSAAIQATAAKATEAVRQGCFDFMVKPLDDKKVEALLDTFVPNHGITTIESTRENARCLYRVVGKSPKLARTVELAKKIAPTSAPVLISGESGTGKELIAWLVHHKSKRSQGPYIKINCAALNDSLLESELFGHEKGAFTGAHIQRRGRFEMAHGGTLLLDEIAETPVRFQSKLLRVLEQQEFERVGGNENITVNVRIISTTNKDLLHEVQQERFRQDLYYRLSGVRLVISPLRDRTDDLPELVWYFVNLYARETQRQITKLDPIMIDMFAKYHWPGNVRQLRNVVRTSLILGTGQTLSLADVSWLLDATPIDNTPAQRPGSLSQPMTQALNSNTAVGFIETRGAETSSGLGGVPLDQIERQAILDTLHQTAGNQTRAAKVLGISDRTLREKIRRYRQQGCPQLV